MKLTTFTLIIIFLVLCLFAVRQKENFEDTGTIVGGSILGGIMLIALIAGIYYMTKGSKNMPGGAAAAMNFF